MSENETGLELALRGPAPLLRGAELDDTFRLAKALATSGMFPDARSAEQALAKVLVGRDLGMSPTQALTGIHIIEGKPQVAATTLAGFVRRHPDYDFKVLHHDNERCALEFYYRGEPVGTSEFSMADARRAKLVRSGSPWEKFPANMCYARAMSNGVKWFAPDAAGGIPVYHEGEIESAKVVDGGAIPGEAVDVPQPTLDLALESVDEDLREPLRAVVDAAKGVRPGQVTPAAVQMSVRGQSRERVLAYVQELSDANEAVKSNLSAEEVERLAKGIDRSSEISGDGEAVLGNLGDGDAPSDAGTPPRAGASAPEAGPPVAQDGEGGGAEGAAEEDESVVAFRSRLEELRRRLGDGNLSPDQVASVEDEVGYLEGELRARGTPIPGQESLL